jgi:hypothetical protein
MTAEHGYVGLSLEIYPNWWCQFLSKEITDSVYFSICPQNRLSVLSSVQKRFNWVKLWRKVLRERLMLSSAWSCLTANVLNWTSSVLLTSWLTTCFSQNEEERSSVITLPSVRPCFVFSFSTSESGDLLSRSLVLILRHQQTFYLHNF